MGHSGLFLAALRLQPIVNYFFRERRRSAAVRLGDSVERVFDGGGEPYADRDCFWRLARRFHLLSFSFERIINAF